MNSRICHKQIKFIELKPYGLIFFQFELCLFEPNVKLAQVKPIFKLNTKLARHESASIYPARGAVLTAQPLHFIQKQKSLVDFYLYNHYCWKAYPNIYLFACGLLALPRFRSCMVKKFQNTPTSETISSIQSAHGFP